MSTEARAAPASGTPDADRDLAAETVIEPRAAGPAKRLNELWRYRHLLRYFGDRAVEKRTSRTLLGSAWLVIRPVVNIGIKGLIFGLLLGVPSGNVPYLLFFLVGMSIWIFFDYGLLWTTRSIEINRRLLTKVYFPRLLLPFATILPALLELGVALVLVALALAGYGLFDQLYLPLDLTILLAPAALIMCMLLIFSIGLFTSVLGATTRDMRFSLRFVTDVWFYLTPVIYPLSLLPDGLQTVASLNPMTPILEMFKLGLIGEGTVEPIGVVSCLTVITVTGTLGLRYFVRVEAESVDRV